MESEPVKESVVEAVENSAPKEKKKRKKSRKNPKEKGRPKFYKNGYVRYCDKIRPLVCKENPDLDHVEVTKLVAQNWYGLTKEEKKPYYDEAKVDKERYENEMQQFSMDHPNEASHIQKKEKSTLKSTHSIIIPPKKQKNRKQSADSAGTVNEEKPKDVPKENEIPTTFEGLNCDLPIFTDKFLEHNKAIESELKILRKNNLDLDQQNSLLMKHVENMENGIRKVEGEIVIGKAQNQQLEAYLARLKNSLVSGFHSIPLPVLKAGATIENIEKYMAELTQIPTAASSPGTVHKATDIIRKMDFKFAP